MPGASPLCLTMGEPAGIGGEIALKAWLARDAGVPTFFALDRPERLRQAAEQLGMKVGSVIAARCEVQQRIQKTIQRIERADAIREV